MFHKNGNVIRASYDEPVYWIALDPGKEPGEILTFFNVGEHDIALNFRHAVHLKEGSRGRYRQCICFIHKQSAKRLIWASVLKKWTYED